MIQSLSAIRAGILSATVLAACASTPSGATSPGALASADKEKPRGELICRYEMPTGSHIRQRVCYTQEELDAMSREAQEDLRRALLSGDHSR